MANSSAKRISVMAWIEDEFGNVVFVRQAKGSRRWTLPGGKVNSGEGLISALRREVREEISMRVVSAAPLDLLDRPRAGSLTILYRVLLKPGEMKPRPREIEKISFRRTLPADCSETAAYFWKRAQRSFEPLTLFAHPASASRRRAE
ncbi:MAG: NUDIX hydrolase [Chthoniobacterales bacterium]|jgi:ADP-ribose pyrophosphatase YjhB (NUDIX family)